MAMTHEHFNGAYDQQGWQYSYDNYDHSKAMPCWDGSYAGNEMYQQQQPWMYGQMQQQQQQWLPQDNYNFAQQAPMANCGNAACLIDLDEYSDMSSDSENEAATPSAKASKAAASKMAGDDNDTPLKRCGSEVEPAAEPAPAALEAKIRSTSALNITSEDAFARTETSVPDTPGSRFYSSSSEPDAEASIKCESDFSDTEVESQPGELFSGNVADLLRWRSVVSTSRNVLGYGIAEAASSTSTGTPKYRAPGRASAELPRELTSSSHAATSSKSGVRRSNKSGGQRSDKGSVGFQRATKAKLEVSEKSWAAQQRLRRKGSDSADAESSAEVIRTIKSILNKLTIEKFPTLSKKLMEDINFDNTEYVEFLIAELFEKATTQHHFIDMYGDLCALLQEFFTSRPVVGDEKFSFKRLLLNECQRTFERCLKPPEHRADMDQEERDYAERLYKDKMLGNIRFVGALLARNMLASKVLLAILEELLAEPTPEALESLAVLLVQIGPIFDTPQWTYHAALKGYFEQVKSIISKDECPTRIRCLLKDVLDLRSSSWQDLKPKRLEGPMKLNDVAKKKAAEEQQQGKGKNDKNVSGPKSPTARTPLALKPPTAKPMIKVPVSPKKPVPAAKFEETVYRAEMQKTFAELRVSHDATEAIARLAAAGAPPAARQAALLCDMLVIIVEEANAKMRKAGFAAVAGLFLTGAWGADGLPEGVRSFLGEACDDLRLDVPALPQILAKELKPQFLEPLTQKALLQEAGFDKYLK